MAPSADSPVAVVEPPAVDEPAPAPAAAVVAPLPPIWAWLATGASLLVVLAVVRAVRRGFVPLDDDAVVEVRAYDVFSSHPPLIGMVSSASGTGDTVHHPGPLLFDLLAIPVRLFPHGAGVAVGAGAIMIASIWLIGWSARRALGRDGAVVVVTATCVLMWALGSEALYEPWPPIVTIVPGLVLLVGAWAFASGRDETFGVVVVAFSFVVQTHGSYLVLAPVIVLAAALGRLLARRRRPVDWRWLVGGVAVGFVLWLQPLIDQLWGSGNLGRIVRFARDGGPGGGGTTLGLGDAVRAAAMVLVRPPFWLRGGVASSLPNGGGFVRTFGGRVFRPDWLSAPVATLGLLAIAAVVVAFGVVGRRRGDDAVVAGALVSVAALVGAVISLSGLPIDEFGFSAHKARWLWAIGAFLTAFVVVSWLRVGRVGDRRDAVLAVAVFGGIALVAAVPTSNERLSPQQYLTRYDAAAQRLRDAADDLVGRGTIFIDTAGRPFPDPYNDTIAAELVRRGVDVRVRGDYIGGQYGTFRQLDDDEAVTTVRVLTGHSAIVVPEGYERIALTFLGPLPTALVVRTDDPSG